MNKSNDPVSAAMGWLHENDRMLAGGILLVTLLAGFLISWLWPLGMILALLALLPGALRLTVQPAAPAPVAAPVAPAAPPVVTRLRGRYRTLLEDALQSRQRIDTVMAQTTDAGQRRVLEDALKGLPALMSSIESLALRAQNTSEELEAAGTTEELTNEVQDLEGKISASGDAVLKSQYGRALDRKLQQLQNLADATVALRRMDAQLENALSTLDTLRSQLMRIQSSQVLSYSGVTDRLSGDLQDAVDSLKATADAMDSVYGWGAPK